MRPGENDLHVDRYLTNLSIAYQNEQYIADQIFPIVPVNFMSDLIPAYDKSYWFRLEAKKLGPTEPPPRIGYKVSSDSYFCEEFGVAHEIPDRVRENADSPYQPDRDGMALIVEQLDMLRESRWTTDFWKLGVWGTDWTGGTTFTKWSSLATSTPIVNLRAAGRTVRRKIMRKPNLLVLGDLAMDTFADHPEILDRIKFGATSNAPAMVTPNLIAQLLTLEELLVGTSMYTTDAEGTAEASITYSAYWDDDALLLYRPPAPSLRTPAAGYTFVWRSILGGRRYIRRRREPLAEKSDLIEGFEWLDQKATATDAGLFMDDCVD